LRRNKRPRTAPNPPYPLTDPLRWEDNEWRTRLDAFKRGAAPTKKP
jgi:hypothetical protein